ncbi:MAG: type II secretion system protein GspN [Desulfuromonas sp.]|nr:MAG: type II secretion system protein GspN [Desulfuromonas sp.]
MRNRLKNLSQYLPLNLSGVAAILGYVFLGLTMVLLGLYLAFPEKALQRRLEFELNRNISGAVSVKSAALSLPFGLTARDIRIRMNDRSIPQIFFDSVEMSPHISALFGNPGISFNARTGDGKISGSVKQRGPAEIDIDNYLFDEPIQQFSGLKIKGVIRSARLETEVPTQPDSRTRIEVVAENLNLTGLEKVGFSAAEVALGNLELTLNGQGRKLDLERASLSGGDIRASLSGNLSFGRSLPATRLNLTLQVQPTTGLDQSLRSLFDLLGSAGPDASRKLTISGSLARPNIR